VVLSSAGSVAAGEGRDKNVSDREMIYGHETILKSVMM
jgi:hypothetical protein